MKRTKRNSKTSKAKSSGSTNELEKVEKPSSEMQEETMPGVSLREVQDLQESYLQRVKAWGVKQIFKDAKCAVGLHVWTRYHMGAVRAEVAGVGMIKGVHTFYCGNCGELQGDV